MLELLEKLSPKFRQEFNKNVSLNELTRLSLQLSPKTALVVTNQAVYVLRKKLFSLNCESFYLDDIKYVDYQAGRLTVEPLEDKGRPLTLQVAADKEALVRRALVKLKHYLPRGMERIK